MLYAFVAIVSLLSILVFGLSLVGLFFKRFRRRSKWMAATAVVSFVTIVPLIFKIQNEEARSKGFADFAEMQAAKNANVTDAAAWRALVAEKSANVAAQQPAVAAQAPSSSLPVGEPPRGAAPTAPVSAPLPYQQVAFNRAIELAQARYKSGKNELQRGSARPDRARAICSAAHDGRAQGWTGTLEKLSTNSDGLGVLAIKVADNSFLKTNEFAFIDQGRDTLIQPDATLYRDLLKLKRGDKVKFSGTFFPGDVDCFVELSATQQGSLTQPEFLFRFTRVEILDATNQHASP